MESEPPEFGSARACRVFEREVPDPCSVCWDSYSNIPLIVDRHGCRVMCMGVSGRQGARVSLVAAPSFGVADIVVVQRLPLGGKQRVWGR